jgi:phosphoglycolate phosphatase-like HAD superfamily hydrolase
MDDISILAFRRSEYYSVMIILAATAADRHDALIFDLDGTLWDACEPCAQGWNAVLAPHGHAVSADQIRSVAGRPFEECIRTLVPEPRFPLDAAAMHAIDEHERRLVGERGGVMYEGVATGLPGLARCIYIGDTEGDRAAATTACVDFAHAAYGFGCVRDSLVAFSSFPQLTDWFQR